MSKPPAVQGAIDHWTPFLLGQTRNPGNFSNDMFIVDIVDPSKLGFALDKLHWLLLRGVDSAIICFAGHPRKKLGIYWRIPGFLFFCHIRPHKDKKWEGTSVARKGILSHPQNIRDSHFGDFLLHRLEGASKAIDQISETQRRKMNADFMTKFRKEKHERILDIIKSD